MSEQGVIERVGVVGCGLMGSGIAEVSARAGLDVVVREVDAGAVEAGQRRVTTSLDRGVRSGKLTEEDRDTALSRIGWTTDLADLADRDLVVEAVVEDEGLKTEVFATLDKVVDSSRAILASNTSSIPIMKLGMATGRPEQVVGIHFFNPVPVLRLVEVVTSLLTSPETTERASTFATDVLHKRVIRSQDRAGFIVNALLVPYLLSAIRMLESGFASPEDIDIGMMEGCNHPMGPLRLTDLIGLDTTMAVADSLYTEFKEPLYAVAAVAVAHGRGRSARPQGRARLLRLRQAMTDRVLVAKVGLDGHDRGVKVVARMLRDAGFEVIYTGLFQTPDTVAAAAVDEDVDAIGLSMLSGAHLTLAPRVVEKVRDRGADIPVIVGGIIPEPDVPLLKTQGVAAVLTPGATADDVVKVVREAIERSRAAPSAVPPPGKPAQPNP